MNQRVALYSAVDDALTHYEVDVEHATLTARSTVRMSAKVQYAWPHPSRSVLYVSTSTAGPRMPSAHNHLSAMTVAADGALSARGPVALLPRRPVHLCLDPAARFAFNTHNFPLSSITVHRLADHLQMGEEVVQDPALPCGIDPHQGLVFPSGRTVLIVDRGHHAQADCEEQPGALRTFHLDAAGRLSPAQVIAPQGGYGFGPRHGVFHPTQPWLYLSDERNNRLYMFRLNGDEIEAQPAFTCDTLADPGQVRPRQIAGPIHIHPDGKTLYLANRADHTMPHGDVQVFSGGENNIAVFQIDASTGEPRPVQHANVQSFHVRTFACDPSGRLLVTASIKALNTLEGDRVTPVPAALSLFSIQDDGRLNFVRKYDVDTPGSQYQFWIGMIGLP